ncbi:hypothetical protein L917_12318, partial [Phytophthora nicotianae]
MPRSPASTIYHLLHGLRVVLFLEERSVRDKLLRGAVCAALSEFNISRNSIKKFWCIRGTMDAISAPTRVKPNHGRRLMMNE